MLWGAIREAAPQLVETKILSYKVKEELRPLRARDKRRKLMARAYTSSNKPRKSLILKKMKGRTLGQTISPMLLTITSENLLSQEATKNGMMY